MTDEKGDSEDISELFSMGSQQLSQKDDVILGNDHQPDGVYLIVKGFVKAFSINDTGDDCVHIIYGRDDIFPLTWAYLGNHDEPVYFEALEDTMMWRISRALFLHHIQMNPKLGFALSRQLARQLQQLTYRIDNLEHRKAYERVAYSILAMARRFGMRVGDTTQIDMPMTHETFANSINLARETVSRQIEKLIRERIITTSHHHIVVLDMPALIGKAS